MRKDISWRIHFIGACILVTSVSLCGWLWRERQLARAELAASREEVAALELAAKASDTAINALEQARAERAQRKAENEKALQNLADLPPDADDSGYFERIARLLRIEFEDCQANAPDGADCGLPPAKGE